MAKGRSKYEEMRRKIHAEQEEKRKALQEAEAKQASDGIDVNMLLDEVNKVMQEAEEATKVPIAPVRELAGPESQFVYKDEEEANAKLLREVLHPEARKAYNIWYDGNNRYYYMDVIEYEGTNVLSIKTDRLTVSQAMAMAKVQRIFTEKLILRKRGV